MASAEVSSPLVQAPDASTVVLEAALQAMATSLVLTRGQGEGPAMPLTRPLLDALVELLPLTGTLSDRARTVFTALGAPLAPPAHIVNQLVDVAMGMTEAVDTVVAAVQRVLAAAACTHAHLRSQLGSNEDLVRHLVHVDGSASAYHLLACLVDPCSLPLLLQCVPVGVSAAPVSLVFLWRLVVVATPEALISVLCVTTLTEVALATLGTTAPTTAPFCHAARLLASLAKRDDMCRAMLRASPMVAEALRVALTRCAPDSLELSAAILLAVVVLVDGEGRVSSEAAASLACPALYRAVERQLAAMSAAVVCPGRMVPIAEVPMAFSVGAAVPSQDTCGIVTDPLVVYVQTGGELLYMLHILLRAVPAADGHAADGDAAEAVTCMARALVRTRFDIHGCQAALLADCVTRIVGLWPSTAMMALAEGVMGWVAVGLESFASAVAAHGHNTQLPPVTSAVLALFLAVRAAGPTESMLAYALARVQDVVGPCGRLLVWVHNAIASNVLPGTMAHGVRSLFLLVLHACAQTEAGLNVRLAEAVPGFVATLHAIADGAHETADDVFCAQVLAGRPIPYK